MKLTQWEEEFWKLHHEEVRCENDEKVKKQTDRYASKDFGFPLVPLGYRVVTSVGDGFLVKYKVLDTHARFGKRTVYRGKFNSDISYRARKDETLMLRVFKDIRARVENKIRGIDIRR